MSLFIAIILAVLATTGLFAAIFTWSNRRTFLFLSALNQLTLMLSLKALDSGDPNHARFYADYDKVTYEQILWHWWQPPWKLYIGTSLEEPAKALWKVRRLG